jgi:hypothetical protein
MSYYYKVLRDNPIGFWKLDDSSSVATDYSGCQNNGSYSGVQDKKYPIVSGSLYSSKVTSLSSITLSLDKDYYGQTAKGGFSNINDGDNDFSIECWLMPQIETDSLTTIVGDKQNNIGIFWDNGNIVFGLDTDYLEYSVPDFNKSLHIVCTYNVNKAFIYVDGILCVSKVMLSNPFTNTEILLKSGPTEDVLDKFLINNIAIYRYGLTEKQIYSHYVDNSKIMPIQIAYPDNGEVFYIYDNTMRNSFSFSYPKDKSWEYFLNDDLVLNKQENYIEISRTEAQETKEVILNDIISMPSGITMDSSKILWKGDNGVKVYTSLDDLNYTECKNGEPLPQFKLSGFSDQRFFYIRVVISSENSSKYLPKLHSLEINFYSDQILYSKNGGSYISKIDNLDSALGEEVYPILSNNSLNGILVDSDSGFKVNTSKEISTIEFFYTPSTISSGSLISASGTEISWASNGNISKTNISGIYVNGINKTSETQVSGIFKAKDIHHVVVTFSAPITEEIVFNYKEAGSEKSLYQYVTLYEYIMGINIIKDHYALYTEQSKYQSSGSTLRLSENTVNLYNNDWVVLQNS